jgi:hypothetical protein
MPFGSEVVFGFWYEEFGILEEIFGFEFPKREPVDDEYVIIDEWQDIKDCWAENDIDVLIHEKISKVIDADLEKAHHEACLAMGWELVDDRVRDRKTYRTPISTVNLSPFKTKFYFDPDEVGELPCDAVVCVPLSSRYWPTFIDWRSPHGASSTLKLGNEVEVAIEHIKKHVPHFNKASLIAKNRFY